MNSESSITASERSHVLAKEVKKVTSRATCLGSVEVMRVIIAGSVRGNPVHDRQGVKAGCGVVG